MKINNSKGFISLIAVFLFVGIVALTFQSCIKDNFKFDKIVKTKYNPNIAVPLVYSSLTIQDILNNADSNGVVVVDKNNFCTIVYRGNLFSLKGADLLQLPDQQPAAYSTSLTAAQIAVLTNTGTVAASYSETVTFSSGTAKIDSIQFKSGMLSLSLNSDFQYSGQIVMRIPAAKKNGIIFSKTIPFTYSGTLPVIANGSYDLTGYSVDMTLGGTTNNQFAVYYDVTLSGSGTPPSLTDKVTFSESLGNMKFTKFFGDVGQLSLSPGKDTTGLAIFKNSIGGGSFTLVNPSAKFFISNSYGIPIKANMSQLDGYNPPATLYPITGSPNPLPIPSPNFSQIGQTLVDSFSLTSTNSNIISVINNTPKYVIYQISSLSNPAGPTHTNFILDSSYFKVDLEMDLPLWGTAKDFSLVDTLPLEMDQSIPDNVESALFRIYNSNGFPFDVNLQAYFTDTAYKKLDSLIIPNQLLLKSGIVNATGIVTSPTPTTYDAVVSHDRLLKLKNTKHVLIKAVAATTSAGATNIKVYSTYNLDVKIGMQVKVNTQF